MATMIMTAGAKLLGLGAGTGLGFAKTLSTVGAVTGAVAPVIAGSQAKQASDYEAAQLEQRGRQELAKSSYQVAEQKRQGQLVASRARAQGAASGGGSDFEIESAIEEEDVFRQALIAAEGEDANRSFQSQAAATRFGGRQRRTAGVVQGLARGVSGYTSLRDKYA